MIAALMQPYLFPYLGYFQLIRAADVFVLRDDVQYIKGGWINRNRIIDRPDWLTLPVADAPSTLPIRERRYADDGGSARRRMRERIAAAYARAPRHREVMPVVDRILAHPEDNVATFNAHALAVLCAALRIDTRTLPASALDLPPARGADGVVAICRALGADAYINPEGGAALYPPALFAANGLRLGLLRPRLRPYPQFGAGWTPSLSIIDAMMFNDDDAMDALLADYDIVAPAATAA